MSRWLRWDFWRYVFLARSSYIIVITQACILLNKDRNGITLAIVDSHMFFATSPDSWFIESLCWQSLSSPNQSTNFQSPPKRMVFRFHYHSQEVIDLVRRVCYPIVPWPCRGNSSLQLSMGSTTLRQHVDSHLDKEGSIKMEEGNQQNPTQKRDHWSSYRGDLYMYIYIYIHVYLFF